MPAHESIRARPAVGPSQFEYDPHDWRSHFFDIEGSILPRILLRMAAFVCWTAGVVAFHELVRPVSISDKILSITGIALSLFLVFRTNSSYDRWWEGRKQWGAIVNETRNLARMVETLLAREPERAAAIVRWTVVFAHAVKQKLRGERDAGGPLGRLPQEQVRQALGAGHIPLAIARRISSELAAARAGATLGDVTFVEADRVVLQLVDYMGACERILSTPLPFGYVVHLRRAIVLYLGFLPFALLEPYGRGTVGIIALIGFILLGIEEIGVEIENPFGRKVSDLPLDKICGVIEGNLEEIAAAIEARGRG